MGGWVSKVRTALSRFMYLIHAIYIFLYETSFWALVGLLYLPNPLLCGSGYGSGLVGLGLIRVDFDTNWGTPYTTRQHLVIPFWTTNIMTDKLKWACALRPKLAGPSLNARRECDGQTRQVLLEISPTHFLLPFLWLCNDLYPSSFSKFVSTRIELP